MTTDSNAILADKSNFRKGSDALPGVVANQQVGPTFSEIAFGNYSKPSRYRPNLCDTWSAGSNAPDAGWKTRRRVNRGFVAPVARLAGVGMK